MLRFPLAPLLLLLSWKTLPSHECAGQEITANAENDTSSGASAKQFQAHALHEAEKYEIRKSSVSGNRLTLRPEPILRWTNPVPEKQMRGEVFVWTDDGRPAAVLCLFEMTEGKLAREYHEFSSLATERLVTTGDSPHQWVPAASPLRMAPLPSAPLPADAPRPRLAQMRELASQFTCEKNIRTGETRTLRLLSQPLMRYASETHAVIDGALFAFVEATDPELFLLIEFRRDAIGNNGIGNQWHYGFARMASVGMKASLAGATVWEVKTLPYDGYRNRPDLPYTLLFAR
jgi:hypothetical protein